MQRIGILIVSNYIMTRPILASIHLSALQHNYHRLKSCAPRSLAYAVVKANAYGHGLLRVAQALKDADGFALLEIEQAQVLRQQGFEQPILLLEGVFEAEELPLCAANDFRIAVHSTQQIEWLEQAVLGQALHVCLKLNTGMSRLGFEAERARDLVERLSKCPNVQSITLMAHFATADEPAKGIDWQLSRFRAATADLSLPVSLANSAALIDYPEVHGDWVRPGISLYGASPFAQRSAQALDLKAAMSLTSRLIAIQELAPGTVVGYGASFKADKPMRIGIVACGYADGYPRHAPSGTPVLVEGQRSALVGRVSMDMLAIDISDIPAAQINSLVELWGQNLPIDDVASAAGTISYELMCAIAQRVPVISA